MVNTTSNRQQSNVEKELDYSKAEPLIKNIEIPNSLFMVKWVKDQGYAIGIGNIQISKNYQSLDEALNTIGYGVEKDQDGDEVLVKVGDFDYEMIVRIITAIMTIEEDKNNG